MEPEADKAAAPAAAAEANDDAIQEEFPAHNGNPGSEAPAEPEVEVQLFRRGREPVAVFRSRLGGWTQDQLEVGDILEQHGLKSVFAFDPASRTRGVAIRFHPRNGRSILTYAPGSTIFLDGEPKDSLLKPITKVVIGVAAMTALAAVLLKEAKMPEWLKASRLGDVNFPPWVLACMVIVFLRLRKRTKDIMKKFGWASRALSNADISSRMVKILQGSAPDTCDIQPFSLANPQLEPAAVQDADRIVGAVDLEGDEPACDGDRELALPSNEVIALVDEMAVGLLVAPSERENGGAGSQASSEQEGEVSAARTPDQTASNFLEATALSESSPG